MPIEQRIVVEISCDNSACPGNELDPSDREGWTIVSAEVYGQPPRQYAFCCPMCAGTLGERLEASE